MDEQTWLNLENRVRALIKDLLEPTIRRVTEHRDQIHYLENKQELTSGLLADTNISMTKFHAKLSLLDEYSKKLMEFDSNLNVMQTKFEKDREDFINQLDHFRIRLVGFDEVLSKITYRQDVQKNDIKKIIHDSEKYSEKIEEIMQNDKTNFSQQFEKINDMLKKIDEFDQDTDLRVKKLREELEKVNFIAQSNERSSNDLRLELAKLKNRIKVYKNESCDKLDKFRLSISRYAVDFHKYVKENREYLDTDYSLKFDLKTIDTLLNVTSDLKNKKTIAEFANQKFTGIDQTKLSGEISLMLQTNKKITQEVIETPLPPEPVIQKRKKDRSSNSDSDSSQYSSEQDKIIEIPRISTNSNVLFKSTEASSIGQLRGSVERRTFAPESLRMSSDSKDISLSGKKRRKKRRETKAPQIIMPDLSWIDKKIEDEKSELMREIEHLKTEILSMFTLNSLEISKQRKKDSLHLNELLNDLQKQTTKNFEAIMKDNEEKSSDLILHTRDLEFKFLQATNDYNMTATQRKRDLSDISAEFKQTHTANDSIKELLGSLVKSVDDLKTAFNNIIDYAIIQNVLISQDENDRESIFLMGYKETSKKLSSLTTPRNSQTPRDVVSLNKSCLSCTGQSSMVLSAFKLACLTYTSSPIIFQQQLYSRKELIEIQTRILSAISNENRTQNLSIIIQDVKQSRSKTSQTSSSVRKRRPLSVPGSSLDMTSPSDMAGLDLLELPSLSTRKMN